MFSTLFPLERYAESPSPYSAHNFVLYLENSEGDQEPLGGFEEVSDLPSRPPGCHKVDLALRRGVCNARNCGIGFWGSEASREHDGGTRC